MATSDLELVELAEIIEARMAACEPPLPPLPLDRLRTAFQLEATEQRCLWLALAYAVSSEVRAASGCTGRLPLEVFDRAVYGSPRVRDRFAVELGPHGRLLRYGLLEVDDSASSSRFARVARISDAIVELAYGGDRLGDDVAEPIAAFVEPPATDLLVDLGLIYSVRGLVKAQIEQGRGPVPIVRGPAGCGKRALLAMVASELDARALVADCRAMPDDARALTALQREAILGRAVLVLAHADACKTPRLLDTAFRSYPGPLAITASQELGVPLLPSRGTVFIDVPTPADAERQALWLRYQGEVPEGSEAVREGSG